MAMEDHYDFKGPTIHNLMFTFLPYYSIFALHVVDVLS
jgi:hypothetical protein